MKAFPGIKIMKIDNKRELKVTKTSVYVQELFDLCFHGQFLSLFVSMLFYYKFCIYILSGNIIETYDLAANSFTKLYR